MATKAKRSVSAPRRPEKKWGPFAGGCGVAVWLNEVQTAAGPRFFRSDSLQPRRSGDRLKVIWWDSCERAARRSRDRRAAAARSTPASALQTQGRTVRSRPTDSLRGCPRTRGDCTENSRSRRTGAGDEREAKGHASFAIVMGALFTVVPAIGKTIVALSGK